MLECATACKLARTLAFDLLAVLVAGANHAFFLLPRIVGLAVLSLTFWDPWGSDLSKTNNKQKPRTSRNVGGFYKFI